MQFHAVQMLCVPPNNKLSIKGPGTLENKNCKITRGSLYLKGISHLFLMLNSNAIKLIAISVT